MQEILRRAGFTDVRFRRFTFGLSTLYTAAAPAAPGPAKELYGLVGYPLGHSFSAQYFAEKFAREGRDAAYANFPMERVPDLHAFAAERPQLRGLNVTIPHKQAVIPQLDALSPEAEAIGAVNVVRVERGGGAGAGADGVRLVGYNTDAVGFRESLEPLLTGVERRALVLGTGGASRAVAHGLRQLGIAVRLVSRTRRGEGCVSYADVTPEVLAGHLLVVNCSPVGMHPRTEDAPAIPYAALTPRHLLYDLVYNPLETAFLRRGRERGARTKNGLEMLHRQAEAAWRIWNG
ncbi:MAG: shikimate dehydrogenase [Alloprevotella sp.]|nr:shikimate dehydrogenase [Alloprevotella sp.]